MWDLPKGKKEKGESKKETAVREVMEETGLESVQILSSLPDTFHTYKIDKVRVMKLSFWYLMETSDEDITPQTEEDIEKVVWADINDLKTEKYRPIYQNIQNLIDSYFKSF